MFPPDRYRTSAAGHLRNAISKKAILLPCLFWVSSVQAAGISLFLLFVFLKCLCLVGCFEANMRDFLPIFHLQFTYPAAQH